MASRGTFLLVAVDPGDPGSERIVDEAAALARDLGASLRLLAALPHGEGTRSTKMLGLDDEARHAADKAALLERLRALAAPIEGRGIPVRVVVGVGDPARVVLERARLARLVVVGTHGRKGLSRVLFGSVAEAIVRDSPTPVLVVGTH